MEISYPLIIKFRNHHLELVLQNIIDQIIKQCASKLVCKEVLFYSEGRLWVRGGRPELDSWHGRICILAITSRPALGLTQPLTS
jgi:hypothetical protein